MPYGYSSEKGAPGEDGAPGDPGSVWSNGSGAPDNGTGVDGDYYLDTSNSDVYQKVSGEWSLITNIGVGVAMGSIAVATPSDHATVEALGDTFELVADNDSPAEGNVGVQWGVFQAGAPATGRLIVASEPTGAAGLLHVGNSSYKYYALAATDPEYVDYYWIEWPSGTPYTSEAGAAAIALAINTNDSAAYSATAGGPDENGCYYVDIVAVEEGSEWDATAYITSSDLSGGDITGGASEGVVPDTDAVVALALATALGNEGQVRTAIDPAGPAEVILIAKVSGLAGKAVITTTGTGLTATNMS